MDGIEFSYINSLDDSLKIYPFENGIVCAFVVR